VRPQARVIVEADVALYKEFFGEKFLLQSPVTRTSGGYRIRSGSRVPPSLKRGLWRKRFTLILISEEVYFYFFTSLFFNYVKLNKYIDEYKYIFANYSKCLVSNYAAYRTYQ
jgi:hypothetical protein